MFAFIRLGFEICVLLTFNYCCSTSSIRYYCDAAPVLFTHGKKLWKRFDKGKREMKKSYNKVWDICIVVFVYQWRLRHNQRFKHHHSSRAAMLSSVLGTLLSLLGLHCKSAVDFKHTLARGRSPAAGYLL